MPIKTGAPVRQVTKPIEGAVAQRQFNDSHDQMEYLVESTDADGVVHSKWFLESEIEETPGATA